QTPAVPPQMMLLPRWFPVTIYSMSSWSRTIFVPLSIVSAMQPVRQLSPEQGIRELFIKSPETWGPLTAPGHNPSNNLFSWNRFFRWVDAGMWFCRRHGFTPFRRKGIKKALDWTLEHFKRSDGPGAIYPPIIWALVAFKSLGYADTSPEVSTCRQLLDDLVLTDEQEGTCRLQPCKSPVWDTSLTLKALLLSGLPEESPTIQKGIDWLISKQILNPGDWNQRVALMKNRGSGKTAGNFCGYSFLPKVNIRPGGWAFEYNNEFYPDNDDTAMALMVIGGRFDSGGSFGHAISGQKETALPLRGTAEKWLKQLLPGPSQRVGMPESQQKTIKTQRVIQRGLRWLFAMQSRDGGWGAFDKDNIQQILCKVPFADHNAMIDPSSPDLTGRVMESLGRLGFTLQSGHPAIQQSVDFMRKQQLPNGSWFGRWGVHYIYGTWQALTGLTAVGVAKDSEMVQAGVNWLLTHQDRSGGWGESPNAYRDLQLAGQGTPTASQTAWAVMGLIAAGLVDHPATYRGIQFLLRNQNPDGTWTEKEFTGTGFPQVFYLRYHYYPVYFPLMALSLFLGQSDRLTRDSCLQNEPGDVPRVGAGETERRSGNAPVSG
ncbi:MAG: hypothetical protein IKW74_06390, partial [Thermoguttaceae bacterium]|nr:hypothetical protein [Thermoguttaceae bacterium]